MSEETAARRTRQKVYSSPVEQVKQGLTTVMINAHSVGRMLIVASLLNDKNVEELGSSDIGGLMGFDINELTNIIDPAKLREIYTLYPGDGNKKNISIRFSEQFYNVESSIVDSLMKSLPEGMKSSAGISFEKAMAAINKLSPNPTIRGFLDEAFDSLKEKFIDNLKDMVEFKMYVDSEAYNENTGTKSLTFYTAIEINPIIYKEIVDSEEFSPYLLNIWIYNNIGGAAGRRGVTIIDPRTVSAHSKRMNKIKEVAPKVNERNYVMSGSGAPMFIPPKLDTVKAFMDKANACVNEEGMFDKDMLIEKYQLNNKLIYVDWVNDILAFTSSTGRIETIDLGGVVKLDPSTEYMFLSSPIYSSGILDYFAPVTRSVRELSTSEAIPYADSEEAKEMLNRFPANRIVEFLDQDIRMNPDVRLTLMHILGYSIEQYEKYPDAPAMLGAFRALVRLLRKKIDENLEFLVMESKYKALGIKYRITGIQYILDTISEMKVEDVDKCHQAYSDEKDKQLVDNTKKTFEIPNLHIGKGGLSGFLPHQGRINSSLSKTPSTAILPISTGGGKTIQLTTDAIMGIVNRSVLPLISTKGNLVRGMITEINAITKGKVNAIPFRPSTIRVALKRQNKINSWMAFYKWFTSLPPNTILVNSYSDFASKKKLFDELETMAGFADAPVYTNHYILLIKMLGIKMFVGDESHLIKNPSSARSRNSYAAFSQGDVRHIASGTFLSNTIADAVGQSRGVNPYIFGDDVDNFAEIYGVSTGLIKNDEEAKVIKDRLRSTTAYHEASEEDWSYMLPMKDDIVDFAEMTPKQVQFYNLIMRNALLMMMEAEKQKGKKKEKLETDDDDEDDDDDDDEDEADAEERAFIAKAQVYLQKVEAWLAAPDEDEDYIRWIPVDADGNPTGEGVPSGDDLVSPKVRLADKYLDNHFSKYKGDLAKNKALVLGYNKVASKHFLRYSKYAKIALHYTSGDEEVIRKYENDDKKVLMVGDETSIREGNNWQMTSIILRLQSVWTPGEHKQTIARMFRPDPRGKYNKDFVRHVWLMTATPDDQSPSLDEVKMARLISKIISLARFNYEGRQEWKRVSLEFDNMEMLRMNLDLIFRSKRDDLQGYFGSWKTFINWENSLNKSAKARIAQRLEQEFEEDLVDEDGNIRDINKFIKLAMYEVTSETTIKGSRKVWVPFYANAIPADPNNWGFEAVGTQDLAPGTVVYSSWGPAIVVSTTLRSAKIQIYDGRTIGVKRNTLFTVNPSKYKEFSSIVKSSSKWKSEAMDINGVRSAKSIKKVQEIDDDEVELNDEDLENDDEDEDEDDLIDIDPIAAIINGWPAILIMDDIPELKKIKGWNRVDPFISVGFRSWKVAEKFLELFESKVHIDDAVYDALHDEMEEIKDGTALQLGRQINMKSFRDFFMDQKKRLGKTKKGKMIAKPYWIANETEIRLAFDIDSHDPKIISWLMRQKGVSGIKNVRKNEAMWINTFKTLNEAYNDLDNLNSIANVDKAAIRQDMRELREVLQTLRKARRRPDL